MTYIVGLTGGVASGKSHVHSLFAVLSVPVLEADDVGRAVVAPGEPALAEIEGAFGAEVLLADGSLNRPAMRRLVFANPEALAQLEAITHPYIRAHIRDWIAGLTAPYGILTAAILLERGLEQFCHRVLVVDTPAADQLQRLMVRDGISPELAQQMLARQMSRSERLARADDVLENPEPTQDLGPKVQALHAQYLRLAAATPT